MVFHVIYPHNKYSKMVKTRMYAEIYRNVDKMYDVVCAEMFEICFYNLYVFFI